jgi:hypothetical protein
MNRFPTTIVAPASAGGFFDPDDCGMRCSAFLCASSCLSPRWEHCSASPESSGSTSGIAGLSISPERALIVSGFCNLVSCFAGLVPAIFKTGEPGAAETAGTATRGRNNVVMLIRFPAAGFVPAFIRGCSGLSPLLSFSLCVLLLL